ncbi:hypothetical protein KCV07_g100, partial [Aureobasidium melanogenum]
MLSSVTGYLTTTTTTICPLQPKPLFDYALQEQNENDLNAWMRVFVDLRQDLKDLTLKKIGADSWVWPVIEKFTKDLSSGVPR